MEGARLVNRPMSAAAAASALVIVDGATTIPNSNSKTIVFHERSTRVRSSIKIPARPTANFFLPEQYSSFGPLSKPRERSSEDRVVYTLRWSVGSWVVDNYYKKHDKNNQEIEKSFQDILAALEYARTNWDNFPRMLTRQPPQRFCLLKEKKPLKRWKIVGGTAEYIVSDGRKLIDLTGAAFQWWKKYGEKKRNVHELSENSHYCHTSYLPFWSPRVGTQSSAMEVEGWSH